MMTKQQERETLNKISDLIAAAGPDSYIGMAFAGCVEMVAENIENDFVSKVSISISPPPKLNFLSTAPTLSAHPVIFLLDFIARAIYIYGTGNKRRCNCVPI